MHCTITLWTLYEGQTAAVTPESAPFAQRKVQEPFRKAHHTAMRPLSQLFYKLTWQAL